MWCDGMRLIKAIFTTAAFSVLVALANLPARAADPTLAAVKKRDALLCGVNGQLPGFSTMNEQHEWTGFETDFCRAIAAATLGDASKVKFVPLTARNRFDTLRSGEIDVLARNSTATLERTVKTGVRDAAVIYIDGQAVAVRKGLGISALSQVAGHTVCILNGTPYGRNMRGWFGDRNLSYSAVTFNTQKEMYDAFYAGKCDAVTQDISAISTTILSSGKAADYQVLREIIAEDPLAAYVRAGDDEWFDVVRWTFHALIGSEARGVTRANVELQRRMGSSAVKRLLGEPPDDAKLLGLDDNWAFNIIKQVGNYGEIYERNLGEYSRWKFPRGMNALSSSGGVLYALPLR
jgi:general L-amino acid transport system substrate-binding protein